jgi:phage-related protein
LWEVRVGLDRRVARVILTIVDSTAVLVHGFIKKSQRIPNSEIDLARRRARMVWIAAR